MAEAGVSAVVLVPGVIVVEVCFYGILLPGCDGVDVAETSTGGESCGVGMACWVIDCHFGVVDGIAGQDFGGADAGYVWAAGVEVSIWDLGGEGDPLCGPVGREDVCVVS